MRLYSIIIAVYNVENYLKECLDSVLAQTYNKWECILVDDGSTDENSAGICDQYAQKDSRFRVFHRENEGSLMARRYGLTQSQGEYLLFIDSDDYMHKELLSSVDEVISKTQSDLVIYRFKWVNGNSERDSEFIFPEGTIIGENGLNKKILWEKLPICNSLKNLWLKVVSRQCMDIDVDYTKFAFLQFGTDLMQSLPILDRAQKIYFTEKVFYYYRYNNAGITSKKAKKNDMESIDCYFRTKDTIMQETLYYMEKYGSDSEKMIRIQYTSYFRGCMETMVSWLINAKDKRHREQIMDKTLQNPSLLKCKNYDAKADLTGIYHGLFRCYKANQMIKMKSVLYVFVLYRKLILLKAGLVGRK